MRDELFAMMQSPVLMWSAKTNLSKPTQGCTLSSRFDSTTAGAAYENLDSVAKIGRIYPVDRKAILRVRVVRLTWRLERMSKSAVKF